MLDNQDDDEKPALMIAVLDWEEVSSGLKAALEVVWKRGPSG
jgi:hypothetical protein